MITKLVSNSVKMLFCLTTGSDTCTQRLGPGHCDTWQWNHQGDERGCPLST